MVAKRSIEKEREGKKRLNPIMSKYKEYKVDRVLPKGQIYIYDGVKTRPERHKEEFIDGVIAVDIFNRKN